MAGRPSFVESVESLPPSFREDDYHLFQRGVYDSPDTDAYVNEAGDFAFLHPRPEYDYVYYKSRVVTLDLATYKKSLPVVQRRYEKIAACFEGVGSVLEVGAADASFLAHLATHRPGLALASGKSILLGDKGRMFHQLLGRYLVDHRLLHFIAFRWVHDSPL